MIAELSHHDDAVALRGFRARIVTLLPRLFRCLFNCLFHCLFHCQCLLHDIRNPLNFRSCASTAPFNRSGSFRNDVSIPPSAPSSATMCAPRYFDSRVAPFTIYNPPFRENAAAVAFHRREATDYRLFGCSWDDALARIEE
jgi:hypothetical protein